MQLRGWQTECYLLHQVEPIFTSSYSYLCLLSHLICICYMLLSMMYVCLCYIPCGDRVPLIAVSWYPGKEEVETQGGNGRKWEEMGERGRERERVC